MFRVEFFCDDKKLGDAYRALLGIAHGHPVGTPMVNVEKGKNGGLKQATNGKLLGMFAAHLKKRKIQQLKAGDVKAWLESQGNSPLSYSYVLTQAVEAGILKRNGTGSASVYAVAAPVGPKPLRKKKR